jgi:hypothetical protein
MLLLKTCVNEIYFKGLDGVVKIYALLPYFVILWLNILKYIKAS